MKIKTIQNNIRVGMNKVFVRKKDVLRVVSKLTFLKLLNLCSIRKTCICICNNQTNLILQEKDNSIKEDVAKISKCF